MERFFDSQIDICAHFGTKDAANISNRDSAHGPSLGSIADYRLNARPSPTGATDHIAQATQGQAMRSRHDRGLVALTTSALLALGPSSCSTLPQASNGSNGATDMTTRQAQQRLLTVAELPNGWTHVAAASGNDTVTLSGITPASCVESWTALNQIADTWETAPVVAKASFVDSSGTATITEEITDDPRMDSSLLRVHLETMIQECSTYYITTADGAAHIGTIVRGDPKTSKNDISLTQTVTDSDGTPPTIFRLTYLIDETTIATLRNSGTPGMSADDFTSVVLAASRKLRSSVAP